MRKYISGLLGLTKRDLEIARLKEALKHMEHLDVHNEETIESHRQLNIQSQKQLDDYSQQVKSLESVIAFEESAARMQPIFLDNDVPTFRGNLIVRQLVQIAWRHGVPLEQILRMSTLAEDKEQVLQLIGVSVSSYQKSVHVSLRSHTAVRVRARDLQEREKALKDSRPAVLTHKSGGIPRGEIAVISSGTGVGKSTTGNEAPEGWALPDNVSEAIERSVSIPPAMVAPYGENESYSSRKD